MEFTDLITELKNPTMTSNIIIIGLCVFGGMMLLALICECLKFSFGSGTFTVLAIITMAGLIITCIATAGEKIKYDYELSRDKNYVYIDSHNQALNTNKALYKVITFVITSLKNMDVNVFIVEKPFLILK